MSGYLSALQRMAGAPASSGATRSVAMASAGRRKPRAARAADGASAWVTGFEHGPSSAGALGQAAGEQGVMSNDAFGDAAAADPAATQATGVNAPSRGPGGPEDSSSRGSAHGGALPAQRRPAAPDLARHGLDATAHPAIQAALRWVSGDPFAEPGDGDASTAADQAAHRRASSRTPVDANSQNERSHLALGRTTTNAMSPNHGLSSAVLAQGSAAPTSAPPSQATSPYAHEFALDLDLPGAAKPLRVQSRSAPASHGSAHADHDAAAAVAPAPDRVEISIGSIHVKVDAPTPPRSVAIAAPAPPRPAITQAATHAASQAAAHAAMHSAFSRSRLPR